MSVVQPVTCDNPLHGLPKPFAIWRIWTYDPLPCGCVPQVNPKPACDDCFRAVQATRYILCPVHLCTYNGYEAIDRAERL